MFDFLGRERAQIELYGKLPLAKDYLRVGCGEGAGRELREWLDQGFGSARDAASQPVLPEPLRFFGQAEGSPLQGWLWPSSDEGGKRSFPFAVFVERRKKALVQDLELGLERSETLWRELESVREDGARALDGARFLESVRGRELALHELKPRAHARADLDDWLAALWPGELLDGLRSVLEDLRELARSGRSGPWRLPLARALPVVDQVLAWILALRELEALERAELPTLFLPASAGLFSGPALGPAWVVASNAPLASDQVAWLLAPQTGQPLGERDMWRASESDSRPRADADQASSLRDSMRGILASLRAR
jgi:hypothetical protein